jgi:epoxide hydrolase-like predicted phosphatase
MKKEKGNKFKALMVDLGGVIIDLDFSAFIKEVIPPTMQNAQTQLMMEFFRQSDIYHQGLIEDEEFYHLACNVIEACVLNKEEFFKAFNSIISEVNENMINLIKNIKRKNDLKLICISNINSSHHEYIKEQDWNIFELFDDVVLSHEVKITKPNPKIFKNAIKKAKCKPKEIIYIDDGLNNVKAAQEMNINAIKFNSVSEIIKKLKDLGVKV